MSYNKFCLYRSKSFRNYLRSSFHNLEIMYLMLNNLLSFVRSISLFDSFFYIFYDDNDRRYT